MNWTSSQPFGDFTIPTEPLPEGLDWDAWCGQTEPVPFSTRVYLTYNEPGWHNITSYSGGSICNHGSHALDCVQWALGADRTGPIEITAKEKRWDAEITYRYANGVEVKLENPPPGGVKEDEKLTAFGAVFHGDKGSLYMHRGRFNTKPISISQEPIREDELHLYRSNHHLQNWFDCIRSRKKCAADVEIGHRSCSVCHLGNIARWTGRKLTWDPEKEVFPGDAEANALLSRRQRHGYELPKDV